MELVGRAVTQRASPPWDFDETFRSQWRGVVRLAYATTGSVALAEEIAQEVFADLFRQRGQVQNPQAWLRRAVVYRTTSWLRRLQVERRYQHLTASAQTAQTEDGGAGTRFADLLGSLSPKQQAVLFLRYHEDLSEQEIAQILGCRPGTVKSLTHRALARLREGDRNE